MSFLCSIFGSVSSVATTAVVGFALFKLANIVFFLLERLYAYNLRPAKNLKSYGQWAVVTGATDGIGKAYAFQLAKQGLDIVLISRTQSKLDDVKQELAEKYGNINIETIAADLSLPTAFPVVSQGLSGLDIGVLINNVGISYDFPEYFHLLSDDRVQKLVDLNMVSVNEMTRIVLPGMVERKRGAVVNIASGSGYMPTPFLTVYSAAKAYVDFVSRALNVEYASKGITFQSVIPLFVTTKLSKFRRPTRFIPTPETFVKSAIRTIGLDTQTCGYFFHDVQLLAAKVLPESMTNAHLSKLHLGFRKRALAKLESEKQK